MMRSLTLLVLMMVAVATMSAAFISVDVPFSTSSEAAINLNVNGNLGSATVLSLTVELLEFGLMTSNAVVSNLDPAVSLTANFDLDVFSLAISVPGFAVENFAGALRSEGPITVPPNTGNVFFGAVNTQIARVFGTVFSGDCLDGVCSFSVDKDAVGEVTVQGVSNFTTGVLTNVSGVVRFTWETQDNEEPEIPEPATVGLVGSALLGLGLLRRRWAR